MIKRNIPPTRYPYAVERAYERGMKQMIKNMVHITLQEYDRAIKMNIKAYHADADELTFVQRVLQLVRALTLNIFSSSEITNLANTFVSGLNLFNMKNMNDQARVAGVNPIQHEKWLNDFVKSSVTQNVGYIKSIQSQFHDKIEAIVYEGMKSGTSMKEIREQIMRTGKVSESKAELIAVDQSGSIHGQLTKKRHEEMGVSKFQWLTAGDSRVRKEHQNYNGKTYDYKNGANGKFPGSDYRCRCVAIPVFN
ncbi:minor capsid protein [Metabacillus fastidiosus]|uniref:phage head morphogenesis protein n=1 Tax=Metabacillus fastidiosus TaxID=1458 RepID=UPI002E24A5F1|nr:minor capsid protein [Metabacillus fastidiosus]MED4455915.1 minor capsid protein [Metabacillus fastidiosus]